jgi:hypothetical protein
MDAQGMTTSARWLALPLLLGALVSLTVGLLAREEAIAPGSYPGGYFRRFYVLFFIELESRRVHLAGCLEPGGRIQARPAPIREGCRRPSVVCATPYSLASAGAARRPRGVESAPRREPADAADAELSQRAQGL